MNGGRAIEARSLRIDVGARTILREINVSIDAHERIALVGSNGAGKSTLLKAIAGFCSISGGSLRVLDTDLSLPQRHGALRQARSRIAQVHQSIDLVGRLSVIDNVLIGGAWRSDTPMTWFRRWPARERCAAHDVLHRVGMGWAALRRTDSLSGGERQKIAIARALHQRAPILLADEPTSGLDSHAVGDILGVLNDVVTCTGVTLISVVHDLELIPRLAERAIVLSRGRLVADIPVTGDTPIRLRDLLR